MQQTSWISISTDMQGISNLSRVYRHVFDHHTQLALCMSSIQPESRDSMTHQHSKHPDQGFPPGDGWVGAIPQPNHARYSAEDAEEPLLHDIAVSYVQLTGPCLCTACMICLHSQEQNTSSMFRLECMHSICVMSPCVNEVAVNDVQPAGLMFCHPAKTFWDILHMTGTDM